MELTNSKKVSRICDKAVNTKGSPASTDRIGVRKQSLRMPSPRDARVRSRNFWAKKK